ncbi:MAG: hypothetical protein ABI867_00840 [Kofleriaceae bacterium]
MLRLVALIALTGCLREPVFQGNRDGGSDAADTGDADTGIPPTGVTATAQAGRLVVAGPFYQMQFSASGARYPESLSVAGSANALAVADSPCGIGSGVGISAAPGFALDGDRGSANEPTIEYAGPAVVKVTMAWTQQFTCGAATNTPTGTSTFTFFPSGQIVRHDSIAFAGENVTPSCPCDSLGTFLVNSHWTFHRSELPIEPPPPAAGIEVPSESGSTQVCAASVDHSILFGFEGPAASSHMVLTTSGVGGDGYGLFSNIIPPASTLSSASGRVTTQVLLAAGAGHCLELSQRMLVLRNPTISVTASEPGGANPKLLMPSPRDGVYGGETVEVAPVTDAIELTGTTGAVPAGFAVKLAFLGPRTNIRVSRSVSDYLLTRPTPESAIVYFLSALGATPIEIIAEP